MWTWMVFNAYFYWWYEPYTLPNYTYFMYVECGLQTVEKKDLKKEEISKNGFKEKKVQEKQDQFLR